MRVAIYARPSTANNGQDPTMQMRELKEYVSLAEQELNRPDSKGVITADSLCGQWQTKSVYTTVAIQAPGTIVRAQSQEIPVSCCNVSVALWGENDFLDVLGEHGSRQSRLSVQKFQ